MSLRWPERQVRATVIAGCKQSGTHKVVAYVESDGNKAGWRKYAYSGWEIIAPKCSNLESTFV